MGNEALRRDRRVNAHESDTELAAVWYAANYYYEASYDEGCEWGGAVFYKSATRKFSLTLRKGAFGQLDFKDIEKDVPDGAELRALWHTHLPADAMRGNNLLLGLNYLLTDVVVGYDEFSTGAGGDTGLAQRKSAQLKRNVPFYLVTATVIKRYSPLKTELNQTWHKPMPARMAKAMTRK
jgi:hypothetical protein